MTFKKFSVKTPTLFPPPAVSTVFAVYYLVINENTKTALEWHEMLPLGIEEL